MQGDSAADDPREAATAAATSWWHVAEGKFVDTDIQPRWLRTGYMHFPYAAYEHGCWWVLRANYCFPVM
jgi:hypothetical protein